MNNILIQKFFSDPDWAQVENMILTYIEPLKDMSTIDLAQPAEHVKAEVIGRIKAYEVLSSFLSDSKLIGRPLPPISNPFR